MNAKDKPSKSFHYTLHDGEEVVLHLKPSKIAPAFWLLSKIWPLIATLFFIVMIIKFYQQNVLIPIPLIATFNQLANWVVPLFILMIIGLYIWLALVANAYNYVVTNQRLMLRYGLFSINTRIIPYSQVSGVNVRATLLERIFGLRSVYIDAIGTSISDRNFSSGSNTTRMDGLSVTESRKVVDAIGSFIARRP
jgi:uncharacterized membrane protein YdbT with pleckstrin-like domain